MSKDAVLQSYSCLRANGALEREVSQALDQNPSAAVEIGAREGAFTEAELKDGLSDLSESGAAELDDDDLDLVVGGGSAPLNNVESTGSAKS